MSLAEFRGHHQHAELAKLAELHFRHDLTTDDREVPKGATKTITWHASFGSIVGLESAASWPIESAHCVGTGSTNSGLLTSRSRPFSSVERHVSCVSYAFYPLVISQKVNPHDALTVGVADVTSRLAPSPVDDFAAYLFLGIGGLFPSDETGFLTGTSTASTGFMADAYRAFKIDLLRQQVKNLEQGIVLFGSFEVERESSPVTIVLP